MFSFSSSSSSSLSTLFGGIVCEKRKRRISPAVRHLLSPFMATAGLCCHISKGSSCGGRRLSCSSFGQNSWLHLSRSNSFLLPSSFSLTVFAFGFTATIVVKEKGRVRGKEKRREERRRGRGLFWTRSKLDESSGGWSKGSREWEQWHHHQRCDGTDP